MNIIIEGCDGVGKTTLVNKLKKYYGVDSIRLSYKDPTDFEFYDRILEKSDCIFDRHFLSEIVYSKLFNRESVIDFENTEKLLNKAHELNIPIFILDTDKSIILDRLLARGTEHGTILNNVSYLQDSFYTLSTLYGIEIIDTTKVSFEEIIGKVEAYREKNRSKTTKYLTR
jgi:thymidylate kinase